MGVSLYIKGIRKITASEREELTGREPGTLSQCTAFLQLFPSSASWNAHYWVVDEDDLEFGDLHNIRHMFSPIQDSEGEYSYVCWEEDLGYIEYKRPEDQQIIDRFLDDTRSFRNSEYAYNVIPYYLAAPYLSRMPSIMDPEAELIVYIYG